MQLLLVLIFITAFQVHTQNKTMTIQFLGMKEGCPNTPKMWASLNEALEALQWKVTIDSLDVFLLSEQEDIRAGYGSPTILVNGNDLFGAPTPKTYDPACRFYRGGVPTTKDIIAKLHELKQ